MNTVNTLFVISAIFVPLLLIALNYSAIYDYYSYAVSLNNFVIYEDDFFDTQKEFDKITAKSDSECFVSSSGNYFCYSAPRFYSENAVSYLFSNTSKISGELHFDKIGTDEFYFTILDIVPIDKNTAQITFADKDYRIGDEHRTDYEIKGDFEFSATIQKFDTFITHCNNNEGTSVTIVQYLGTTTIDGEDYFMTWHTTAESDSGISCNYPQIIQHSLQHDFGV